MARSTTSKKWQIYLHWLDENILFVMSLGLLVLIPAYPKLPLFDIIPGYLVRVRIEDFAVLLTVLVWFIQVLRKKIAWKSPLTLPIILYAVIGVLSIGSAVYISKTVPNELLHIGKTGLHYFRYLEYFSLYFVLAAAIKTRKQAMIALGVIATTLIGITIYGIGQKYLYWPVYSTMNREFAKGIRLILTEHARVQSTFGGHYDLGAYLVIVMPMILALYLHAKRTWRWLLGFSYLGGLWLLYVSASRTSLIAYLVGSGIVIFWYALQQATIRQKAKSLIITGLLFVFVQSLFLRLFGDDLFDRLEQTIYSFPTVGEPYKATTQYLTDRQNQAWGFTKDTFNQVVHWGDRSASDQLADALKVEKPDNAITIDEVLVPSDTRPTPAKPSDVYVDVPTYVQIATSSADGSTIYSTVEKPRVYSENALTKGLSLAIRLDTLWPRALQGFYTNPFFGSGYATLTKDAVGQFTEAESTDNNFLRTIGETGALGFVTFYGVLVLSVVLAIRILFKSQTAFDKSVAIGYLAGAIGLSINAGFIDVFAASKVAFYFWALTGLLVALYLIEQREKVARK